MPRSRHLIDTPNKEGTDRNRAFGSSLLWGGPGVDARSLRELVPERDQFLERYFPLFGHEGNRAHVRLLVQGRLLELRRWDEREILHRSRHRQERNALAQACTPPGENAGNLPFAVSHENGLCSIRGD